MPKIKDLGVKVIPETMRPPEMGLGGGGHCFNNTFNPCVNLTHCTGCSFVQCSGQLTITWKFTPVACLGTRIWGISPVCGGSMTPIIDPGGDLTFTREGVGLLKEELHRSLEVLEVYEKTLGPQTAEAIDARLRELEGERTQLNQRRKELDKK